MSRITLWLTGIAIEILAVFAQWLFGAFAPQAYGICVACHSRDMPG